MKIITDTSLNYFGRTLEKVADLLGFLIYAAARRDKGSLDASQAIWFAGISGLAWNCCLASE
jgi:hypothetical protein